MLSHETWKAEMFHQLEAEEMKQRESQRDLKHEIDSRDCDFLKIEGICDKE